MKRVSLLRRFGANVGSARKFLSRALLLTGLIGAVSSFPTVLGGIDRANAKTPGKTYCFNRICHRVKTLSETRREIGINRVVQASHYDDCRRDRYNPCGLTSSGERFRAGAPDNAASPIYPDGTKLLVWNPRNGKTLVVRINNAGPYYSRRLLDLSRGAAVKLGFAHRGVARLHVRVLSAPTRREARYSRNRRYPPVPGYVGQYRSMTAALWRVSRIHGGWAGNPASTMARLAIDENRSNPGWLSEREMRRTAWRLRRQARRNPAKFAGQLSANVPLPKAKTGIEAETQVVRMANLEFGLDSAGRTHEPAAVPQSVLLAALPERRPTRATPQSTQFKVAAAASKQPAKIGRKKLVAAKKPARRVRLAKLTRKQPSTRSVSRQKLVKERSAPKRIAKKKVAKKTLVQQRKGVQQKRRITKRKKLVRVASLQRRKSPAGKIKARTRRLASRAAPKKSKASARTAPKASAKRTARKVASAKPRIPVAAKKKVRPAPRVARSNWRVGVMRGGREL